MDLDGAVKSNQAAASQHAKAGHAWTRTANALASWEVLDDGDRRTGESTEETSIAESMVSTCLHESMEATKRAARESRKREGYGWLTGRLLDVIAVRATEAHRSTDAHATRAIAIKLSEAHWGMVRYHERMASALEAAKFVL